MNPQRQHVFQHRDRRLNVMDARLHGPWTITLDLNAFANGNRHVLMPCDFPVRIFMLVEIDPANHPRLTSQNRFDKRATRSAVRKLTSERHNIQKIPDTERLARPLALTNMNPRTSQSFNSNRSSLGIQKPRHNHKTMQLNILDVTRLHLVNILSPPLNI